MRSRVAREIDRFPDSAYETVLIETPAALATSLIVTTVLSRCSPSETQAKRFD